MKKIITTTVLAIVGALAFLSSFYVVKENQYAVIMEFGKIKYVVNEAGPNFKVPIIQNVKRLPKELQLYDIAKSDVITSDKKSMIADNYILWKITNPLKFAQTLNSSLGNAEDRISVSVYNATKNTISSMTQDEIISARGTKLTDMLTANSNESIQEYGVEIVKAEVKLLDLPDANKEAVYNRMISERKNIAASYKAAGESEAQKIKNEADKNVSVMLSEAEKEAAVLEAEGESEYMKVLKGAYDTQEKAEFYEFIRSLDALKQSMSGNKEKKIILDKSSKIGQLFY